MSKYSERLYRQILYYTGGTRYPVLYKQVSNRNYKEKKIFYNEKEMDLKLWSG